MVDFKKIDRIVVKVWAVAMLIIGAISPFYINKAYVYVLSPLCIFILLFVIYRFSRRFVVDRSK